MSTMPRDLETNPDFLNHIAMCLDMEKLCYDYRRGLNNDPRAKKIVDHFQICMSLGLDPENPSLAWIDYPDETPWLTAWLHKQYDSDIDMEQRDRFNPKIKGLPQIEVNNIVR